MQINREMAKSGYLLWIPLLLASCIHTHETSGLKDKNAFSEYSVRIRQVDLPLNLSCYQELQSIQPGFPESEIRKFGPEECRIFGKIFECENFTAILYLYPADMALPILQTTDKQGRKISALALFETFCGEDETSRDTSWACIHNDLRIELSDSAITFQRDKEGERIQETIKTKVRHRQFYVNSRGKILERTD